MEIIVIIVAVILLIIFSVKNTEMFDDKVENPMVMESIKCNNKKCTTYFNMDNVVLY